MPFRPLLLAVLSFCLCGTAVANDRRYDVEIVVLENTDSRAGERERWRPEVVVPEVEGAVALEGPVELAPMVRADRLADLPEGFENLPADQRKLGGAIRKLQESGRYRVLRHLAWQQPALGEEEAPRIRVHNGEAMRVRVPIENFEELDALEDAASQPDGEAASQDPATEPANEPASDDVGSTRKTARTFGADRTLGTRMQPLLRPVEIHPLDGTIRLVVSRYLHVYTDLYFTTAVEWTSLTDPAPDSGRDAAGDGDVDEKRSNEGQAVGLDTTVVARGPDGRAMLSYPFVQHRRMRSGELHYLDHPVLGLLIRVDRAEEAVEDAAGGTD
jgi:hypothetical protein